MSFSLYITPTKRITAEILTRIRAFRTFLHVQKSAKYASVGNLRPCLGRVITQSWSNRLSLKHFLNCSERICCITENTGSSSVTGHAVSCASNSHKVSWGKIIRSIQSMEKLSQNSEGSGTQLVCATFHKNKKNSKKTYQTHNFKAYIKIKCF